MTHLPTQRPYSTLQKPHRERRRVFWGILGLLIIVASHLAAWRFNGPDLVPPDTQGQIAGIAYNSFGRWERPDAASPAPSDRIYKDLTLLAAHTGRIRTYSSTEMPSLLAQAKAHGLSVTLGAWLDADPLRNHRESQAAIAAAQTQTHVDRIILGNETQLTKKLAPEALYQLLDEARRRLRTPVSTAEPWHVWLSQPELARHVDFITVHLLPYWEGVPAEAAVGYALDRLAEVQRRFPHLPVVIGEVGWPSRGVRQGEAEASPEHQAFFVRSFVARAQALGLDYYLMEAIDQPWKRVLEGQAGGHWGVWRADRTPKFAWQGSLQADRHHSLTALAAGLLGLTLALPIFFGLPRMRRVARAFFLLGTQVLAYAVVWFAAWPFTDYLRVSELAMAAGLIAAIIALGLLIFALIFEFSEVYWNVSMRYDLAQPRQPDASSPPKVSLHLVCSSEPPAMVIQTIEHLLALDWPSLEIVIVDNNTQNPDLVAPLATFAHQCADPRLRFFTLPHWPGFKAGALNFALAHTDPQAIWVGVIDADYRVHRDWIRQLSGYFEDDTVGLIQAPQAHRDSLLTLFSRLAYWESEGFFRIGMHHRNQRNAIIQHGTMTLIRAKTLRTLGGWNEACICEDSELGLRILTTGARAVYVDQVFGAGLLPEDFIAYRRQRHRWAQGAMQILKAHWKSLIGRSPLSAGQRYHFLSGWLPWMGDGLHLALTIGAIAWSIGAISAPHVFSLPVPLLVAPLLTFVIFRLGTGLILYGRRIPCRWTDRLGASLAGMGLSHIIARGLFAGLTKKSAIFEVTRKADEPSLAGSPQKANNPVAPKSWVLVISQQLRAVGEEGLLLLALLLALSLFWSLPSNAPFENRIAWSVILVLQSLPYLAAIACAIISAIAQTTPRGLGRVQTKTGHTVHWASPEGPRSELTADAVPQHPPPPG